MSLRKLGVIASSEALSSSEAKDSLSSLNMMLSSWNTNNLTVLGKSFEEFTLIAGQNSYTLGTGGDFNTSVPIKTDAAFIRFGSNAELPMKIIDSKRWGEITTKSSQSTIPSKIYIDNNFPLQTVYLYPTPSEAKTLILHNYRKISSLSSLTTELSFPDGYERAIVYNLAIELAPEYGKTVSMEIAKIASESLANIKRVNIKPREIGVDKALISSGGFDWRIGE
jgi:hypothetical protein